MNRLQIEDINNIMEKVRHKKELIVFSTNNSKEFVSDEYLSTISNDNYIKVPVTTLLNNGFSTDHILNDVKSHMNNGVVLFVFHRDDSTMDMGFMTRMISKIHYRFNKKEIFILFDIPEDDEDLDSLNNKYGFVFSSLEIKISNEWCKPFVNTDVLSKYFEENETFKKIDVKIFGFYTNKSKWIIDYFWSILKLYDEDSYNNNTYIVKDIAGFEDQKVTGLPKMILGYANTVYNGRSIYFDNTKHDYTRDALYCFYNQNQSNIGRCIMVKNQVSDTVSVYCHIIPDVNHCDFDASEFNFMDALYIDVSYPDKNRTISFDDGDDNNIILFMPRSEYNNMTNDTLRSVIDRCMYYEKYSVAEHSVDHNGIPSSMCISTDSIALL